MANIARYVDEDGHLPPETETGNGGFPAWKPTGHELAIMLTLAIISLMVSLDATIIITSLSVRQQRIVCPVDMASDNTVDRLSSKPSTRARLKAFGSAHPTS